MPLQIPKPLKAGDTIGICTPSMPAYTISEEVFTLGLTNIEKYGFRVKLGGLTKKRASEGYRSGSPQARAKELMELFCDTDIKAILTTIGGMNSNSLLPYLDFKTIGCYPKIFCGYSDITSLHLALQKEANLATYYGPGVMPHWSEYPSGVEASIASFLSAIKNEPRILKPFAEWSDHIRNWQTSDWKTLPRRWHQNPGWRVLNKGEAKAPIVVCNLNTLMASAGTKFFPDCRGKILLLEEMNAPLSKEERSLRQLQIIGIFEEIEGLIIGKPENLQQEDAPFSFNDLLMEIVGRRDYPIISEFDCAHTIPMHTIRQGSIVTIQASQDFLTQILVN